VSPLDPGAVPLLAVVAAIALPAASVARHAIAHIAVSRRLDRCLEVYERLRGPGSDAGADITRIARSLGGEPEAGARLPGA
jgi:hypothetical protein